jgi:UPF0755 protein
LRTFFTWIVVLLLALGAWFAWALVLPLTPPTATFVLLHSGYSTRRIARELKSSGVIRSAEAFVLWHYWHRERSLKAGEYRFAKEANALDIHNRLIRGDIYVHTVVIPEGFNMFDIAQAVADAGLGSKQEFLRVATSDTSLISDLAPEAKTLEGYLFPNTYEFTRTQSLREMAAMMVSQFRQSAREIGLSSKVSGVVTMASIIEKETGNAEERSLVASVYYNRLKNGIALDADPCIIYAELLAGTYTGALHHEDMQFRSLYNTYTHAGLPPGPIANPGKSSLEAAMHPAATEFVYFVSDGSGHHRFAQTLEEHDRNIAAYRRALSQK